MAKAKREFSPADRLIAKCRELHAPKYFQAIRTANREDLPRERAAAIMALADAMFVDSDTLDAHIGVITSYWLADERGRARILTDFQDDPVLRMFAAQQERAAREAKIEAERQRIRDEQDAERTRERLEKARQATAEAQRRAAAYGNSIARATHEAHGEAVRA